MRNAGETQEKLRRNRGGTEEKHGETEEKHRRNTGDTKRIYRKIKKHIPKGSGLKRICVDEKAKASFAMAAVLFLLMGSAGTVYLATVNNDFRNTLIENKETGKMNTATDKAHIEVQSAAYCHALDAIDMTTQGQTNQSLNDAFIGKFSQYLEHNFPRRIGDYEIFVRNHDAQIQPRQKKTNDFVKDNNIISEIYNGKWVQELDMTRSDNYQETTETPYYSVCGFVNYTVKERNSEKTLDKNLTFEKTITCPYPFLMESFQSFAANAQGDSTDVGRMIKYILTTAAQYRVLMGYGKKYDNDGNRIGDDEGTDWRSILNESDVELAVNIALLLEEIRRFRTVDPESLSAFDSNNLDSHPHERTIASLIENYAHKGTIDAADIFALYTSLDTEPIEIESIFAQSMYTIIEQYTHELLYHFGLGENTNDLTQYITNIMDWLGLNPDLKVDGGIYSNEDEWARAYNSLHKSEKIPGIWFHNGSWNESGVYYGNQEADGNYSNDSFEVLNTTVCTISNYEHTPNIDSYQIGELTDKTFFYNTNWTRLYFYHKIELNDSNDTAKVQVKEPSSDWVTLATFLNSSNAVKWTFKYYDLTQYNYNHMDNVSIRFLFESNETGTDHGWKIKYLQLWKIYYNGKQVKDVFVGGGNVTVALSKNIPSSTVDKVEKSLDWFREEIRSFLPDLFDGLAKYTQSHVSSLLFGDKPDPKDDNSIFETLKTNVGQRIKGDVGSLQNSISNSEDFTLTLADKLLTMVDNEGILDSVKDTLEDWKDSQIVESWVDEEINEAVDIRVNQAKNADIFLKYYADYFYDTEDNYYSSLRGFIYDTVKDDPYWDDLKGIITDTIDSVIGQVNMVMVNITNFLDNSDLSGIESFLDKILALEGLFWDVSGEFINMFLGEIIEGSNVANTEFQLGCNYDEPFEFWDGYLPESKDTKTMDKESVSIFQQPQYLTATERVTQSEVCLDNIDITDGDTNNDLLIYIGAPQGTHYAQSLENSSRPLLTWGSISIAGRIDLATRTDKKIFPRYGTHDYTWYNNTLDIDLAITISVFSGWELKDVDYGSDNDTIGLLKAIWDAVIPITKWCIDSFQGFIDITADIISSVIHEGPRLGERLYEVFDILRRSLQRVLDQPALNFINTIFNAINGIFKIWGFSFKLPFSAYGFEFLIAADGDNTSIALLQKNGSFSYSLLVGNDYMQLTGNVQFWNVNADIEIRPLDEQEWLHVEGSMDYTCEEFGWIRNHDIPYPVDGWEFEIHAPVKEQSLCAEISIDSVLGEKIAIQPSIGPGQTFNFGIELNADRDVIDEINDPIIEPIVEIFNENLYHLKSKMSIFDCIIIVEEIAKGISDIMSENPTRLHSLELFFEIGTTGKGIEEGEMKAALVIYNVMDTPNAFFGWFLNNIENMIFTILHNNNHLVKEGKLLSFGGYIPLRDSGLCDVYFKSGYYIDTTVATSLVNIPCVIETHIPSFFSKNLGASHAMCGVSSVKDTGTDEVAQYKVKTGIWLLKVEINEWHAP